MSDHFRRASHRGGIELYIIYIDFTLVFAIPFSPFLLLMLCFTLVLTLKKTYKIFSFLLQLFVALSIPRASASQIRTMLSLETDVMRLLSGENATNRTS